MKLIDRIREQEGIVCQQRAILLKAQKELDALLDQRVSCLHTFSRPLKHYEHEGGYCTECGVNELYAYTLAQRAKHA